NCDNSVGGRRPDPQWIFQTSVQGRTRRVRPSETKRLEGEGEEGETGVMGAAARFAHSSRSNPELQRHPVRAMSSHIVSA
ncbi:MAG: hypothetical protein QGH65_18845, partial [SAR324 cluster bacterium]|nr:hypothetical protein [SAR324 cluster bacterium]